MFCKMDLLEDCEKETVRINSPALDMKGRIAHESASGTL